MNGGGEERDCELNVSITRRCHQKPDQGDTESLEYEDLCAPARGGEGPGESLILFYSTIRYSGTRAGTRAGTLCRSLWERGGKWNPVNGMSLYAASRVTGPAEDLHTILITARPVATIDTCRPEVLHE